MVKYTNLEDFAKALISATDENEDGNAMGIVIPEFKDGDIVELFVTPGSTYETIIATKQDGEIQLIKPHNPYYALYWFNGEVPENYYDNIEDFDVQKYLEKYEILACYLLDADDIDQVLLTQEEEFHVKNPFFHRTPDKP